MNSIIQVKNVGRKPLLVSYVTYNLPQKCMSSSDYQHIQNGKTPTMHFQKSLPRLPIPTLDNSCQRYLAAQRPILTDKAFQVTERHVKEFRRTGMTLQNALTEKDRNNKHTSYISEIWSDMYLSDRKPLPINYNPMLVFENIPNSAYNTQLLKSVNMLISSLRFLRSLREGVLEPEVFHINPKKSDNNLFRTITSALPPIISWYGAYMFNAYPLDMSQYHYLFNCTRIPQTDKDIIYQDVKAKHILVMRRGHFFVFDVLDKEGNILPANILLANISHILNDSTPPAEYPLGILTTENRNIWAKIRSHLITIGNDKVLKLIDSAVFNLILDDETINEDRYTMVRNFLHGDGKNRWFDKSFSLIFTKDAVGGVNFEHSWGDGVAVLRYFQDIYRDSIDKPYVHPDTKVDLEGVEERVKKLVINYDNKTRSSINEARIKYQTICDSLDINYIITDGIGKNVCKKHGISPDAVMQLGFQAAFFKQTGTFVASYESCSTAAFKHGRTETIRPCTMATKEFCEAKNIPTEKLYSMVVNCSKVHSQLTKEAAMGQGFDRHLFALKNLALKQNCELPAIFTDPAYEKINYNIISTSTLSSPAVQAGGFGPVVPDGYGIGYVIRDNSLGTLVINYKAHRNGEDYIKCLKMSYDEIRSILNSK